MDRNKGRPLHETNISTKHSQAQTHARLSVSHGDKEWASRFKTTSGERSRTTRALTTSNAGRVNKLRLSGFSRLQRLTSPKEFGQVFAQRTRSSDKYFTVLSSPNKLSNARLGLAISRRVDKHAVGRNRLKRIAREVFRRDLSLPPIDLVVLANRAAPTAGNALLRDSLERHFRRLGKRTR